MGIRLYRSSVDEPGQWQRTAVGFQDQRIAAEFRADCRNSLEDPALLRLVDELTVASPEFALFWKQHNVLERQGGERRFLHPRRGEIRYQQATLRPDEHEHLKFVMLRPL